MRKDKDFEEIWQKYDQEEAQGRGLSDFFDLAQKIRRLPKIDPSPRLLAKFAIWQEALTVLPKKTYRRYPLYLAALFLIFLGFLSFGVATAAQNAAPGDLFYPLKRFGEDLVIRANPNFSSKADLQFNITGERAREAIKVVDDPKKLKILAKDFQKEVEESQKIIEKSPKDQKDNFKKKFKREIRQSQKALEEAKKGSSGESKEEIEKLLEASKKAEENREDKEDRSGSNKGSEEEKEDRSGSNSGKD